MSDLFLNLVNMSLSASIVTLAVLALRFLLKGAPKKWSYLLWSVVGFRLCCPVSIKAVFSVFRALPTRPAGVTVAAPAGVPASAMEYVPRNIAYLPRPRVNVGVPAVNNAVNGSLPAATPQYSMNPMQFWVFLAALIWVAGVILLLGISLWRYWRMKRVVLDAVRAEEGIYETDAISSPFILGFFHPVIYLPMGLEGERRRYVLEHERYHLKRKDHLTRLFAFLLLALHWFNPLVWLGYHLMGKDMELSCDEAVLGMEEGREKEYSATLLSFAVAGRFPGLLAFGETGVKSRIRNALNWKRPRAWVSLIAGALCLALVAACAVNPTVESPSESPADQMLEGLPEDSAASPWGVTLTASDVTPRGLTLTISQSGGDATGRLRTGSFFVVERWSGSAWKALDPLPMPSGVTRAWTTEGWLIERNSPQTMKVNWMDLYGELPGGTYRIGKKIMDFRAPGDFDEEVAYALFRIEGQNGQEGIPTLDDAYGMTEEALTARLTGHTREEIWDAWGEPQGGLSGMYGDIWEIPPSNVIVYYMDDNQVRFVKLGEIPKLMQLTIPAKYADLLEVESTVDRVTLYERQSREEFRADFEKDPWEGYDHPDQVGFGWLCSIARVDADSAREILEIGVGAEFIAKDDQGSYYVHQFPSDVRFYRSGERYHDEEEWAAWSELNSWGMEAVPGLFLAQHPELTATTDREVREELGNATESGPEEMLAAALAELADENGAKDFRGNIALGIADGSDLHYTAYDSATAWNGAGYAYGIVNHFSYAEAPGTAYPGGDHVHLTFSDGKTMDFFADAPDLIRYGKTLYRAEGADLQDSPYWLARSWFDECEYGALLDDYDSRHLTYPGPDEDYLMVAHIYAIGYKSLHAQVTDGSKYKYSFATTRVEDAPEVTEAVRKYDGAGDKTWAFYATTVFVPENQRAEAESWAGNTMDYAEYLAEGGEPVDSQVPEGALVYFRCGYVTRQEDGTWKGSIVGTGW